ncbi:MAG TPA: hypothetical protein VEG39_08775 [Clostridia bacterium]|nr:hypothetical protein [Clostridia bacterium]
MPKKIKLFRKDTPLYIYSRKFTSDRVLVSNGYGSLLAEINLDEFPLVEDFEILYVYREGFNKKDKEVHFIFYSETMGLLNGFPYWYIHESKIKDFSTNDIPIGTKDTPFMDVEQGGLIYIFEKRDYVYVLYSHDNDYIEFNPWYKVSKDLYFSRWMELISWFKRL